MAKTALETFNDTNKNDTDVDKLKNTIVKKFNEIKEDHHKKEGTTSKMGRLFKYAMGSMNETTALLGIKSIGFSMSKIDKLK